MLSPMSGVSFPFAPFTPVPDVHGKRTVPVNEPKSLCPSILLLLLFFSVDHHFSGERFRPPLKQGRRQRHLQLPLLIREGGSQTLINFMFRTVNPRLLLVL